MKPMFKPFLEIRNVSARFRGPQGDLCALKDISFTVDQGEFICLIGPSGCGKSTLLRIIAGLLPPSTGTIYLEEKPIKAPGHRVGLVFQNPNLLPWRTVADNIALPLEMHALPVETRHKRVMKLVEMVGLTGFENEYPLHISGGMAQRAAIARALAQNPEVLLLDEPFGSLDALTRERMGGELLNIWQKYRRTVVMVTHNVEEAALLADRVIVLSPRPGKIVDIISVKLPRPGESNLLLDPQLQQIARQLRQTLSAGEENMLLYPSGVRRPEYIHHEVLIEAHPH